MVRVLKLFRIGVDLRGLGPLSTGLGLGLETRTLGVDLRGLGPLSTGFGLGLETLQDWC